VNNVLTPYIDNDSIHRLQADTYKRELERYGQVSMKNAESLFYYDSYFVTHILDLVTDEQLLVRIQLKNIDDMLDAFKFDDDRKIAFVNRQMNYYKEEHGVNKMTNKQLSQKFRDQASEITDYLFQLENLEEYCELLVLHQQKARQDRIQITAVIEMAALGTLAVSIESLVGSLIHMSVNRTFSSKQRTYEMLLYDFLLRFYRMKKGRKQNDKTNRLKGE